MITEDMKNEILALYNGGVSMGKIAKQFKTSRQTVWYHLIKMGVPRRLTQEERKESVKAFLKKNPDANILEVAEHIKGSLYLAKKILRDLGKMRVRPLSESVNKEHVLTLYIIEDQSLYELSKNLGGISEITLAKILRGYGVPLRPRGASSGPLREEWRKKALEFLK